MSACRGVFVLCNSRWRTYLVSGLRKIEVYAIQGCNKCIVNASFLGPRDSVLFIEVSVFQRVRISEFHCIVINLLLTSAITTLAELSLRFVKIKSLDTCMNIHCLNIA